MSDPVLPAEGLFHRRSVDEQKKGMTIAAASSSATTQTSRNTSNAMTACSYAFVGTMSSPRHPNSWRPSSLLMKMHGWRGKLASGLCRFSVTT